PAKYSVFPYGWTAIPSKTAGSEIFWTTRPVDLSTTSIPCSRHPLSNTISRLLSGDSVIASGNGPRSYETPAGSSLAPVGSLRSPEGSCAAIAASTWGEGELHALATNASARRQVSLEHMR